MGQSVRTKIRTTAFALDARNGSTGRFLKSNRPVNAALGPGPSPGRTTDSPWEQADRHPAEIKRTNINPRPTVRWFQQPALLIRANYGEKTTAQVNLVIEDQSRESGPIQERPKKL